MPAARAFLVLAAVLVVAGCGAPGRSTSESVSRGGQLFVQKCGSCHTMKNAGSRATVGPDLDAAFARSRKDGLGESTIQDVVRGQISIAIPPMPDDLVTGDDADAVAAYVAQCAAVAITPRCKPPAATPPAPSPGPPPPAAGDDAPDGKSIFAAQGCGGCHVLADAGSSGSAGPNLDETKPSVERSVEQITNGGGGMPAFKDELSDAQIRALAEYVSSVAG